MISVYDPFFRNYVSTFLLSFIVLSSQLQRLFIWVCGDPVTGFYYTGLKFVTRISIVQSSEQAPFTSEIVGLMLTLDS